MQRDTWGPQPPMGMPGLLGTPMWVVPPTGIPSGTFLAHGVSSGLEKISKKFFYVWSLFGTDIVRSKKHQPALDTMSIG